MCDSSSVIVLINPNSSEETTAAMTALAKREAAGRARVQGISNTGVPALLTTPAEIDAAARGVIELGVAAAANGAAALVVAAFGDPGLAELRERVRIPVFGIGESAFLAAASEGRRFAIATITPDPQLLASFERKAVAMGFSAQFCGTQVTPGDPGELVRDPAALDAALAEAVRLSVEQDGAEAVIIGGGPLSEAALRLQHGFDIPLVIPVISATQAAVTMIHTG